MLTRLIIINSEVYAKADIQISGSNSLQIIGPNNVGKSTLIYALNFLYIIDEKRMDFSGGRKGNLETISHYFPDVNASFMIFEILKKNYYCILISKDDNGKLIYYKINHNYQEKYYFDKTVQGDKVKKITNILTNFKTNGIQYTKFSNKQDIFKTIYQEGRRNNAVVWVNDKVNTDGNSNNFSKIYKYLINPKLVNNQSLKEILIIADNREQTIVKFKKQDEEQINDFNKKNEEIKNIEGIQSEFKEFKDVVETYKAYSVRLTELVFWFNKKHSSELHELEQIVLTNAPILNAKKIELKEKKKEIEGLRENIGELKANITAKELEISGQEGTIKDIEQYDPIMFLEEEYKKLDRKRKNIEAYLTTIENKKITSTDVNKQIEKIKGNIIKNQNNIDNNIDLLIHNITDNQQYKELLNRILSKDITILLKENIVKNISKVDGKLLLFDGIIQLPDDIKGKKIESIEELKTEKVKLKEKLKDKIKLLDVVENLEIKQKELVVLRKKIDSIQDKILQINELEKYKNTLQSLKDENYKLTQKMNSINNKEIPTIQGRIDKLEKDHNSEIPKLKEIILGAEMQKNKNSNWKLEVEKLGVEPIKCKINNDNNLEFIYQELNDCISNKKEEGNKKILQFVKIKNKIESLSLIADENEFIKKLDENIVSIQYKKDSVNKLLNLMATKFAAPCVKILKKYDEFEKFVSNKINGKLSKIKISDIVSLKIELVKSDKLISDIEAIGKITDLTDLLPLGEDENLKNIEILKKYLYNERNITLSDIFDIRIHLENKSNKKVVSLKNQIESDGTDKMIRLIIVASIINHFVINDRENKIILFIDEMGSVDKDNRLEIIQFCKENNFVPISANPDSAYDGFDKYYMIRRNQGSKVVLSEKNGNVFYRKLVV